MTFAGRRILIVGAGLADLAGQAFRDAALQTAGLERLQARWAFGDAPDLILIEAGAFEPDALLSRPNALLWPPLAVLNWPMAMSLTSTARLSVPSARAASP